MAKKKTDAMRIIEARRETYASGLGSFSDETELLLLSQHYGELDARKNKKKKAKTVTKDRST